jgi:hypothetical protein
LDSSWTVSWTRPDVLFALPLTARRNVRPPPMSKGIIGGLGVTSGMAIVPRR